MTSNVLSSVKCLQIFQSLFMITPFDFINFDEFIMPLSPKVGILNKTFESIVKRLRIRTLIQKQTDFIPVTIYPLQFHSFDNCGTHYRNSKSLAVDGYNTKRAHTRIITQ